jgi:tRNA pseudouridine38-40 synthase
MPRYKLTIEYDGEPFVGWQRQANGLSVQEVLEQAVKAFTGETVAAAGAGRTDAGVHALGQVAHVDLAKAWPVDTARAALNDHLRPHPVSILGAEIVDDAFHARFSAIERRYLYRIVNRRSGLALDRGRAWHIARPLDVAAMRNAASLLLGHHDFTSFRDVNCQARSPVKTLDVLDVSRHGDEIVVEARARSFLHRQVRTMVGTLKQVGEGRWQPADVAATLAARDRSAAGATAPAAGLYLAGVLYGPNSEQGVGGEQECDVEDLVDDNERGGHAGGRPE